MKWYILAPAILLGGLLAACSTLPREVSREKLLAAPPQDWKLVYQLNNVSSRLSDFVPPGEEESDWQTRLSFESFSNLVDSNPIDVLLAEAERDRKNCAFVQHFNLFSGFENNYPASVRLFLCGENSFVNKGEVKMVKAIQGNDYFYIIRLVKRIEPFKPGEADFSEDEIAGWSSYLRAISLCHEGATDHPCPDSPSGEPLSHRD